MASLHVLGATLWQRCTDLVCTPRHLMNARQETCVRHDFQIVTRATLMLICVLHLTISRLAQVTIRSESAHASICHASILSAVYKRLLDLAAVTSKASRKHVIFDGLPSFPD